MVQKWILEHGHLKTNDTFNDRNHYEFCFCPFVMGHGFTDDNDPSRKCGVNCSMFEVSGSGSERYVILHCGHGDDNSPIKYKLSKVS